MRNWSVVKLVCILHGIRILSDLGLSVSSVLRFSVFEGARVFGVRLVSW